jgi:colanic acid/amylovoran biosynthesis protein
MHSNIFALSLGVPTLAISYQPKTDGIMAQLGLGAFVLPITGLSPGHLWQAFDHLRESAGEVREKLRRVIPEQTARAEVAGRLIADDFATPARERA